jgi:hypothetical protein
MALSIALFGTGLFAGGALHISLVEHPARMKCSMFSALSQFRPSFLIAAKIQVVYLLTATTSSLIAIHHGTAPSNWWIPTALIFFSFPYTFIFIMPVNNKLLSAELSDEKEIKTLLTRWGNLHHLRTAFSLAAFSLMLVLSA